MFVYFQRQCYFQICETNQNNQYNFMFMLDSAALPILPTRDPKLVLQASLQTGRINLEQQNIESRTIYNRNSQCYKPVYCIQTNLQKYKFNEKGATINNPFQLENSQLIFVQFRNPMQKGTFQCQSFKICQGYLEQLQKTNAEQQNIGAFLEYFCTEKQSEQHQICQQCTGLIEYQKKTVRHLFEDKFLELRRKKGLSDYNPSAIQLLKANLLTFMQFSPHDVNKAQSNSQSYSKSSNNEISDTEFRMFFKNLGASKGIVFQEFQNKKMKITFESNMNPQKYLISEMQKGKIKVTREKGQTFVFYMKSWISLKEMILKQLGIEEV